MQVRSLCLPAEAEISRLSALDGDNGCGYFWQATRLYAAVQAAGQDGAAPTTEPDT